MFVGILPRDWRRQSRVQKADLPEVVARLDSALTSIFSEDGKQTVLYYMRERYDLTLDQAFADPVKLEKALTGLLGEIGWMVIKRKILEHFWEKKIEMSDMKVVESASLREAFGLSETSVHSPFSASDTSLRSGPMGRKIALAWLAERLWVLASSGLFRFVTPVGNRRQSMWEKLAGFEDLSYRPVASKSALATC